MATQPNAVYGIQSTAGAIPVRNLKGEISMQKVKVQRYISGKRPDYASSADDSDDSDDFIDRKQARSYGNRHDEAHPLDVQPIQYDRHEVQEDSRLRRLEMSRREAGSSAMTTASDRLERRRHIHEPELVESESEDEEDDNDNEDEERVTAGDDDETYGRPSDEQLRNRRIALGSDSESETELSDTEIERRRQRMRAKMMQQRKEEEVLLKEEEKQSESSAEESSEYEEETESEEDNEPRLKPLFVRKRDRATIAEKEKEAAKQRQLEVEAKKVAKERRKQTLRLVEDSVKKDLEKLKPEGTEPHIDDVCTDDDNDEVEYEAWKLRELKRIKRDREEKETLERERTELERVRNMTEEERRSDQRLNPKMVTNKAAKGKYKFLQKYFHRGAFYLDEENDVLKQDFAQATLEDHFNKTVLPKVMQVKNFGRCGRTKYTHLLDQDTTQFDSPWYSETGNNLKFHTEKGGGMRQVFDKPTQVKRKHD